jgi:hypothetical protein
MRMEDRIVTEAPLELEGTWEQILGHASDLRDRYIRLTAERREPPAPNRAFLEAKSRVEEIQRGMGTTSAGDTVGIIREGREGAMYGYGSDESP